MKKVILLCLLFSACTNSATKNKIAYQKGVGVEVPADAELLFDGSREMLDEKWTYWAGPRLAAELPIKWQIVEDPLNPTKTTMQADDPASKGGIYGAGDVVTKKKYKDFRLHVEFLINNEGGNSGVYLQNRYEIQVLDGDSTKHGLGAIINESDSPYTHYNGLKQWNAYDFVFKAARFKGDSLIAQPLVTVYFNGYKTETNFPIQQVWGGPNSGLDGGNNGGKGITDTPGGIKLQAEGHDVRYRNIWIKELDLENKDTDF